MQEKSSFFRHIVPLILLRSAERFHMPAPYSILSSDMTPHYCGEAIKFDTGFLPPCSCSLAWTMISESVSMLHPIVKDVFVFSSD